MKKSLIALAALGAFAGAASAQSSVTLFGIIDTGVRAVKNGDGGTVKSLTNDGLASSRLGFRGEEDLGGGLKASFWIEAGLGVDVGSAGSTQTGTAPSQSAKFFNRRATVSLSGPFGEVRLGRDYVPTFSNLSGFDAYGGVGVGNVMNLIGGTTPIGTATAPGTFNSGSTAAGNLVSTGTLGSNAGTLVRADNTIAYFLPSNIGGVYGTLMAAAGEGNNGTNGNNRYVGGRVGFASGPFDVAGAYARTRIPGNDDLRIWNVGGSFKFVNIVKLSALYHRGEYQPTGAANIRQNLWMVGANVTLGQGEIRATYQRSDLNGGTLVGLRSQDDARQYAIGYIYNLSKRTAIYTDLGRLQNRGGSLLAIPGGTATSFSGGQNSTAFALGVRHSF